MAKTRAFTVLIDVHPGEKVPNPVRIAKAIYRALDHALDSDIENAEVLTRDWAGQIQVHPLRQVPKLP